MNYFVHMKSALKPAMIRRQIKKSCKYSQIVSVLVDYNKEKYSKIYQIRISTLCENVTAQV